MTGSPRVMLRAVAGERVWELALRDPQDDVVIGRGSGASWRIEEALLSRRHVRLSWSKHVLWATELGSRNGTRINGVPLRAPTVLAHGDRIEMGPVTVTVTLADADDALTIGRASGPGFNRTLATGIAPRRRHHWKPWCVPAAGVCLLCLGLAMAPLHQAPLAPTPRSAPRPAAPRIPAAALPPNANDPTVPTGALRRDAIRALHDGRRDEARRLFERLASRLPHDRCLALVRDLTSR